MIDTLYTYFSYVLLGLISTALWAPLLIHALYHMNIVVKHVLMGNKMNEEFVKIHAHKSGTPTMGGLMISVTVAVLAVILLPESAFKWIFVLGWSLMTMYGFVEGTMVFARKVDEKFKLLQETFAWRIGKLVILYLICLLMITLVYAFLGIDRITLFGEWQILFNPLTIALGAGAMSLALYGIEITDGIDGLVTGQFIIALATYTLIVLLSGSTQSLPLLAMTLGSCVVYLYFNINPARVFMGGTGTLPIGFLLCLVAITTNTLPILFILGMMWWITLASSFIQIIAIKFFARKVFRIAPIHHHFEAIGWPETKVVQRFWLFAGVFALVALWVWSRGI